VTAIVTAPAARLGLGRGTRLVGGFCVDRAFADKGIHLACGGGPPP
jgi:hypothetical protein